MPLESLFQLCVKVLVEQRGRSCAQRSCEPDTRCHLFGGIAFSHASICLYHLQFANTRFLMPLECLSQLCVKVLVEQARHLLSSFWWHCLFTCNKLVVDPQFASPVVLSGSLAIQVFKRPMEARQGARSELEGKKLL